MTSIALLELLLLGLGLGLFDTVLGGAIFRPPAPLLLLNVLKLLLLLFILALLFVVCGTGLARADKLYAVRAGVTPALVLLLAEPLCCCRSAAVPSKLLTRRKTSASVERRHTISSCWISTRCSKSCTRPTRLAVSDSSISSAKNTKRNCYQGFQWWVMIRLNWIDGAK